jgi:hypothetical protein
MRNLVTYKQANKEYVERVLSLESLIEVHNLVKTRRSVDKDLMMEIAREYPCAASRKINFENYSKYPSEQNVDIALEDIKEVISSSLQLLKKSFISGATGFSKILIKIKENFQAKGSLSNPGIYSETFKFLEDIRKNPILAAMTEDDFSNVFLKANNIKVSTASLTDMEIKQNVISNIKFVEEAYDNLFKLTDWREKKTVELTRDIESGKIVGMEDTSKYQLNFGEFLDEDQAASYNDGKRPKDNYLALGDFYITAFTEPVALVSGYTQTTANGELFGKDSLSNGDLALFFSSVRKAIAKEKTFPDFFTKYSEKAERSVKTTNAMFAAYDKLAKHTEDISLMLNCIKTLKVALILQQRMFKACETYIAVIYTVTTDAEAILTQYASILRKKLIKINKPESLKLSAAIAKHPFLKQFIFLKAGASLESAINETDENEIHYIEPGLDASEMEEDEDYNDKMDVTALVGEPVTLGAISTEGVMENIKNAIAKAWEAVVNFFKKIYNWFTGLFKKKEKTPAGGPVARLKAAVERLDKETKEAEETFKVRTERETKEAREKFAMLKKNNAKVKELLDEHAINIKNIEGEGLSENDTVRKKAAAYSALDDKLQALGLELPMVQSIMHEQVKLNLKNRIDKLQKEEEERLKAVEEAMKSAKDAFISNRLKLDTIKLSTLSLREDGSLNAALYYYDNFKDNVGLITDFCKETIGNISSIEKSIDEIVNLFKQKSSSEVEESGAPDAKPSEKYYGEVFQILSLEGKTLFTLRDLFISTKHPELGYVNKEDLIDFSKATSFKELSRILSEHSQIIANIFDSYVYNNKKADDLVSLDETGIKELQGYFKSLADGLDEAEYFLIENTGKGSNNVIKKIEAAKKQFSESDKTAKSASVVLSWTGRYDVSFMKMLAAIRILRRNFSSLVSQVASMVELRTTAISSINRSLNDLLKKYDFDDMDKQDLETNRQAAVKLIHENINKLYV